MEIDKVFSLCLRNNIITEYTNLDSKLTDNKKSSYCFLCFDFIYVKMFSQKVNFYN